MDCYLAEDSLGASSGQNLPDCFQLCRFVAGQKADCLDQSPWGKYSQCSRRSARAAAHSARGSQPPTKPRWAAQMHPALAHPALVPPNLVLPNLEPPNLLQEFPEPRGWTAFECRCSSVASTCRPW